jgi:acyltransferase
MRFDFIDNMKGIGILLVILGHLNFFMDPFFVDIIYSFHMPLFFFVSGFLIWERLGEFSLTRCFTVCINNYLKPYLVFFLISVFFFLLKTDIRGWSIE